jgi:ribonuclease HII
VQRVKSKPEARRGQSQGAGQEVPEDQLAAATLARALRPSGFLARLRPLTDDTCLHVGIDENGLGPVLGPMIVTGVAFRFRGPRPTSLGTLVGDSKALVSHADVSLGEAWARAILASLGEAPRTPADVIDRLSMDHASVLRAPCPSRADGDATAPGEHAATMCWPETPEAFVADDALVERCARTIRGWAASGDEVGRHNGRFTRRIPIEVVGLRASILCASRLNEAKSSGRHKFAVDLHEMERIALAFHAASTPPAPLDAVCGKVGGMGYYSDYFGPLSGSLRAIEAEGEMASAYRFPGLGRMTFLQDADAADPLVGLASIVGKYLRELLMGRIVRYMQTASTDQELAPASGYRDPNTKKFIAATELIRKNRQVPDRCFLRTS